MSAVIGPCASRPGSFHPVPVGTFCDKHLGRPAAVRVQGETDSMGAELLDLCQECYEKHQLESAIHKGTCEWCLASNVPLLRLRDSDEGRSGRLYDVCHPCRDQQVEDAKKETRQPGESAFYDGDWHDSPY